MSHNPRSRFAAVCECGWVVTCLTEEEADDRADQHYRDTVRTGYDQASMEYRPDVAS